MSKLTLSTIIIIGSLVLGGVCIGYMQGHINGQLSVVHTIAEKAEKHKQRFYDEGYAAVQSTYEIVLDPNDEGILVGIGPTRDYSNYSDPCMLAQGASYNTDPNIMWSVEVSSPKFASTNLITFHGSDGVQRSIGAKELKEMTVEEIKNMATCIIIMSYSGGLGDELNDILIKKLLP